MRDRTLGPLTIPPPDGGSAAVDFRAFVSRLVLSEQLLISSGVDGFAQLVQKFGYDGMSELLRSKRIRVVADVVTVAQTGQTEILTARAKKGLLPHGSYSLSVVRLHDLKTHVRNGLQAIDDAPGLRGKQGQKLRALTAACLMPVDEGRGGAAVAEAKISIERDPALLTRAIALGAAKHFQLTIDPTVLDVRATPVDDIDFRVETNLSDLLALDREREHKVVERGVLGVAGLHQTIEDMKRYEAVGGFQKDEVPLFEEKLGFLAAQLDPDAQTDRFQRVVELLGLPDVDSQADVHDVDLARLLEVVQTEEAVQFRHWLRSSDTLTDEEIAERFHPVREKLAHALHGTGGKAVRFLAATGAGLALPGVGIGLGALDSFLTERVLREDGPSAFLGRLYPSVFQR